MADLRPEKADFRPEKADFRPRMALGGGHETENGRRRNKNCPMWNHRTSACIPIKAAIAVGKKS